MSDDNSCGPCRLAPIRLGDQPIFNAAFAGLRQPISDYSFANVIIWHHAMKLRWACIEQHLCVFANGEDLTLLLPPLPMPGASLAQMGRCLHECFAIMDAQQQSLGRDHSASRVEYVSDELLELIRAVPDRTLQLTADPMSGDYIYPTTNMIDLPGAPLKSKRKDRARFLRDHPQAIGRPMTDDDLPACMVLLQQWTDHANAIHDGQRTDEFHDTATQLLRRRETAACRAALAGYRALGFKAMVVEEHNQILGFTLGERLSPLQASILFEKTLPRVTGLPQFIFAEFCRTAFADLPEINVGDDWGIPTLRFTKQSYRPSRRLAKYVLSRPVPSPILVQPIAPEAPQFIPTPQDEPDNTHMTEAQPFTLRRADLADTSPITAIEQACFGEGQAFHRRQIRSLITNPHASCLVAVKDGQVIGWGVGLLRHGRKANSGRVYSLAVDPQAQGSGVGRSLIHRLIQQLQALSAGRIYLEVEASNERAISLYRSLGFAAVRVLPDYYGSTRPGLSMRRPEGALAPLPQRIVH